MPGRGISEEGEGPGAEGLIHRVLCLAGGPRAKTECLSLKDPLARGRTSPFPQGSWPVLWGAGYFAWPLSSFLPPSHKQPFLLPNDPSRWQQVMPRAPLPCPPAPARPPGTPRLPRAMSPLLQSAR